MLLILQFKRNQVVKTMSMNNDRDNVVIVAILLKGRKLIATPRRAKFRRTYKRISNKNDYAQTALVMQQTSARTHTQLSSNTPESTGQLPVARAFSLVRTQPLPRGRRRRRRHRRRRRRRASDEEEQRPAVGCR